MNLLKSIFIPAYFMSAMGGMMFALWSIWNGGNPVAWAGVLLTTAPIMMLLHYVMIFRNVARTSARFPVFILLGAVGVGVSGWSFYARLSDVLPLAIAGGEWFAFLLYSFWYSDYEQRTQTSKIRVGRPLPDFELTSATGEVVSSRDLADKPTIFIFYRGNWCPFCMAQVKELVAKYNELGDLGARVAFVSPQPHGKTESLAKKFRVGVSFFTDVGNAVGRKLGIAHDHGLPMGMQMLGYAGETVMPTVIITDVGGTVVWAHETDNYRIRPEPETYLSVLRNLKPTKNMGQV